MTYHLQRLALYVDEPQPGVFYWVIIESAADASAWQETKAATTPFASWKQAWDSGAHT